MKKSILSLGLALLLFLGAILSSCQNASISLVGGADAPSSEESDEQANKKKDSEKEKPEQKDAPPAGYLFAEYGAIRFAYPSDWVEDTESDSLSYAHSSLFSYLSLETAPSTEEFHTMSAEEYQEIYGASFAEELGGTMFNVTAKCVQNKNKLTIATFSCFVNVDELTLKQLLYAVNIGDISYRLVLLLEETSEEMEQTILDSIKEITPAEDFVPKEFPPEGYRFYTVEDLRFLYPSSWNQNTLTDPETNDDINVIGGYSASIYTEMNEAQFDAIVASRLEEQGFTVSNLQIGQRKQANGISVRVITYSLSSDTSNATIQQQIFGFVLNRTAYAMVLTLSNTNDPLAQTVLDSIKNINPEKDPPEEGTTRAYDHLNLRFHVPATWGYAQSLNQNLFYRGTSSISISSEEKNTTFDTITLEEFQSEYVPLLEQDIGSPLQNVSLTRFVTPSNLHITSILYSFRQYNTDFHQLIYVVTVDQTTHTIVMTALTGGEIVELDALISESITAISGPNYNEQ